MRIRPVILCLLCLLCTKCKEKSDQRILRIAHSLDTSHPVHKGMERIGELLERKSEGTLIVQIYPGGQLGGEREALELLQIGSLDITKVSAAVLENFIPEYTIFSIPYLFKNKEHIRRFYDSPIGDEFLNKGFAFNLKGLCFYDAGSRSFYTKNKEIKHPSDLEGLKIRVQKSNMAVAMVEQLGGSPTPISWGELYTALQQGVVDGAENNLPSFYTSKHYEVCKFYSFDEHTSIPDVLLIGKESWESLLPKEQKWLQEAAKESSLYQRTLWAKAETTSLSAIKEAGVTILYPDKNEFVLQTEKIYKKFQKQPEIVRLIRAIQSLEKNEKIY